MKMEYNKYIKNNKHDNYRPNNMCDSGGCEFGYIDGGVCDLCGAGYVSIEALDPEEVKEKYWFSLTIEQKRLINKAIGYNNNKINKE